MKTFHQLAITETLETLQKEGTNLLDNPFRLGSAMYFEVINEAKKMVAEQRYRLTEVDKQVIETNLGEFDVHEGNYVPLDCPMMVEEEEKGKEPPIGKPKAAVFPVPVCAHPNRSRPSNRWGTACIWMGVGLVYPLP